MAVLGVPGARTRQQVHPELVEVRELLVGAVDGGRALLAVTDERVVVAQGPRDGGECTTIPVREVTAVEWHRGPAVVLALQDHVGARAR